MPWLAATALLHSVNVLAARGGLRAWTMMLALIAFSMSMVGTFLVRSGILTSVHSFAVDPTRGTFILALLAIYIGGALTLFALRIAHVKEGAPFELVSREGGLVANNLILSVILGIVFVGTLYPLIAEALSGEKLSVGPPYFDSVASPLALVLAALMMIAPQLKWRRDAAPILPRLAPGLLVAVAVFAASFVLTPEHRPSASPRPGHWRRASACQPAAAVRPFAEAHSARHLGHGDRAPRRRRRHPRHGIGQRLHRGKAGGRAAR